jgi:GAF domain-containing protein
MEKKTILNTKGLLEALARIASKLNASSGDEALYEILSTLGMAVGVDRTYLFDFDHAGGGNLVASQRAEWVDVGQQRQIGNPELQNFDMAENGFSDWCGKMLDGEVIASLTSELPVSQQEVLREMQDILSIVFVPVFSNGRLRGAIGYDDCTSERIWRAEEIEALRIASSIVGVLCYN